MHDCKKEELARRKTESSQQSGRGASLGKKFSAEFAVDMAVELRFAPEIEWDVLEAYSWYEITDDETLA